MGQRAAFWLAKVLSKPFLGRIAFQSTWEGLHRLSLIGMNFGIGNTGDSGERFVLEYIREKFKEEEAITVFDVGANVGKYTLLVLSTFNNRKVKVFSFEPSRTNFEHLRSNVGAYGNVTTSNFGLGEVNKKSNLFSTEDDSGLSSVYNRRLEHKNICLNKMEEVEIRKLDDFCAQNNIHQVNLLKIDVEGNEYNVLHGAEKTLNSGLIDFIQFEFGGCNIDSRTYFQDFHYLLNPKYRIFRIVQNGLYPLNKYDERDEIFTTVNYLAEKRGDT